MAASLKGLPPETAYRQTKTAKTYQVSRYRVVIEVTAHHTFEPLPLNPDKVMSPATQLLADSKKRRTHTARSGRSGKLDKPTMNIKDHKDFMLDWLAHSIGCYVLRLFSGGRFNGERGFAWGLAAAVGGLVLFSPFVAFLAWLIYRNAP